ncbi:RNA-binding cell elongation regulator Jag/EloR [Macrococcus armenti]|uniref:RNA-binding cell elongation regulator Jag/EloR n=1 Tax=Macrococcus armenti TaxID=2875764 RepID=UPI001CCFF21E|nr:RNA-binding cell elongation regulator Jag/EloR [Macrococcus armenti]UBH08602.1 protein jag [Macrococcus armenti]UBH15381.1 protein jag [Macrococcus armenti]UBH17738.1 protein jag [Macrococcus armenti]UBH20006.1 protein jag [Macrococcus armenti]
MLEQNFIDVTVEDAIKQGLNAMNVTEKQVKIEVIQPGKKGFFGIGKQNAEVKLIIIDPELKRTKSEPAAKKNSEEEKQLVQALDAGENVETTDETEVEISSPSVKQVHKNHKQELIELTKDYIMHVIHSMGYEASAEIHYKNSSEIVINIESDQASRIIGKRGQVLNSLQVLAQNYFNQLEKSYTIITLDIENYREKRKETLQNLALNMSKKAIATGKPIKFEPMPNYERKIMHQILSKIENIETYSEGREPHRYLVIRAR